ncbi:IS110 family transposase [bacterium]|nr:IS110 family transposase [bacterium]
MSNVPQFFIGVDLHKIVIQICIVDKQGEIVKESRHRANNLSEGLDVVQELMPYKKNGIISVEAVGFNRWFVNALKQNDFEVIVCNPNMLNLKMSGKKTDRRDAFEIARRLMLGDIQKSAKTYYPDDDCFGKRKVIRTRHRLIEARQTITNQIRANLNAYKLPSGLDLKTKKTRKVLWGLEWPTEDMEVVFQSLMIAFENMTESIALLDYKLEEMSLDPMVSLLREHLPSCGPVTSAVIYYELGDVTRFKNSRTVASYAGLVPRVNQSADTSHHGRLTKRGNKELRHILGEWAIRLMHSDERVVAWAEPRLKRTHKNKIRMALARRLLIGVYKMLLTGELFSMERCLGMERG